VQLAGVLETVLYCTSQNEEDTRRFYREVLRLEPLSEDSVAHRLGTGVFLLFNADESSVQESPPPHGAPDARVHTCFLAAPGEYDRWKERLADRGVAITSEIEWRSGGRSFYFQDPAGNVLEIAEQDMWPR
jgi:catechol 2,3-dioxygenase-like lactoylglutathione lyase family enzyme